MKKRNIASLNENDGTTRHQSNFSDSASYAEQLNVLPEHYEAIPVAAPKPSITLVTWETAHGLQQASDLALALELNRRGYRMVKIEEKANG